MTHAQYRRLVRRLADRCCEYSRIREVDDAESPFHLEHVIPRKHSGKTVPSNLAWACSHCNLHKGTNISGLLNGRIIRLFHPRSDRWLDHFQIVNGRFRGRTDIGRVTIAVLEMNDAKRVELRRIVGNNEQFRRKRREG